jgi:hypothetical protein
MLQKYILLFIILCFLLFFYGCTRQAPEIYDSYWQITVVNNTETKQVFEKLSFFIHAYDADGTDDLEKIYLLHDSKELFWEINKQTWNSSTVNGEFWIGSNEIRMNDLSDIPEGNYRILLQDVGGEYAEERFLLQRPDIKKSKIIFPKPEIKENRLYVTGNKQVYSLWIYDRKWNHVPPPYDIEERGFDLMRIMSRKKELTGGFYYYLYVFDSTIKRGLLSGPYYYSRD